MSTELKYYIVYTGNNINELWRVFGVDKIYGPTEIDERAYVLDENMNKTTPIYPGDALFSSIPPGKIKVISNWEDYK